jgi:hypothetical protein
MPARPGAKRREMEAEHYSQGGSEGEAEGRLITRWNYSTLKHLEGGN